MTQSQQQTNSEAAESYLVALLDEIAESLRSGKASRVLEYDDAIDLALEVGSTRTVVKMISRTGNAKATLLLTPLLALWQIKANDLLGD